MMRISRTGFNAFIFITLIINLRFVTGQQTQTAKCDEALVNTHMVECYKSHIDEKIDPTAGENAYFMDGSHLCQAYNTSSSYRQCLYSIFDRNGLCSFEQYPYSYQSFKIYWKTILTSCFIENNDDCLPSPLSQRIIRKCHYSFDDKFPTKCKEFLRSLKCLEKYSKELIPSTFGSTCSTNKAYYYFYGDLAARLQLSIHICEQK